MWTSRGFILCVGTLAALLVLRAESAQPRTETPAAIAPLEADHWSEHALRLLHGVGLICERTECEEHDD